MPLNIASLKTNVEASSIALEATVAAALAGVFFIPLITLLRSLNFLSTPKTFFETANSATNKPNPGTPYATDLRTLVYKLFLKISGSLGS